VEKMVYVLEAEDADICNTPWEEYPNPGDRIADTSSFMHKAECLKHSSWGMDGYAGDGILVNRWLEAGMKYCYHNEQTMFFPQGHRRGCPDAA
jgi:hypothetical protein